MTRERIITSFTSLEVVPDRDNLNNPDNGLYPPRLSEEQRDNIDVRSDSRGCIIFNTTSGALETVDNKSKWVSIGSGGGSGNVFEDITVNNNVDTNTITAEGLAELKGGVNIENGFNINGFITGSTGPAMHPNTVITLGLAAGTGSSAEMRGSEMSGQFILVVPAGATFSGVRIATFTLPANLTPDFTAWSGIIFTPADADTADMSITKGLYSRLINVASPGVGATFILATSVTAPLTADKTYWWNYMLIGNKHYT